uniref:Uncharacterized protein n=1 Tax=Mucochytrium quahogii TaxID=96639 RepID=A0A7S2RPI2_9STRA|mmetsp:Transcript_18745/g.30614  ORF Transcript_18745/g.30614 Transcript_18745/m.30614 type:complete len:100 (+) Transcript_18745:78-377(+)
MQRVVLSSARVSLRRQSGVLSTQTARFSTGMEGTSFHKKGKALEDHYFKQLEEETKAKFGEMLHQKELQGLLAVLPENHGLSNEVIHDILNWKHDIIKK